jgi:hypothetical protein
LKQGIMYVPHRVNKLLNFARNGIKPPNDKENLKIACDHFKKVYSRGSSFDPSIVDNIPQRPELIVFNQLPSIKELNEAIKGVASLTALGESDLSQWQ